MSAFDFNQMLRRKYDIMGQQAQAQTMAARAGMMGAETERMGMPSQIAQRQATTMGLGIDNQFKPDLFRSGLAAERAGTRATTAQAVGTEMDNQISPMVNQWLMSGFAGGGGGRVAPQTIGSRFQFGLGQATAPRPLRGFGALDMGDDVLR